MYASHSKLALASNCLFSYKRRYIDKESRISGGPARIGSAFHKFADLYGKHLIERDISTDVEAIPELVKKAAYSGNWAGESMGSDIYSEVLQIAERFGRQSIVPVDDVISLEEKFPEGWDPENKVYPKPNLDGRHVFVGIIDRLEMTDDPDVVRIHDYKTNWAVPSQTEVNKDVQLKRYAWLVSQEYIQFDQFQMVLDFVRHGVTRERIISKEELEDTEKELIAAIDQLEGLKEFPATPGSFCSLCDYSEDCPAVGEEDVMAVANVEQAEKIARDILLLERRLRDRKEALQGYCSEVGPVEADGQVFGYQKSESYDVSDMDRFATMLKQNGKDPFKYIQVNKRNLKTLLNKESDVYSSVIVDASSTRFGHKKI